MSVLLSLSSIKNHHVFKSCPLFETFLGIFVLTQVVVFVILFLNHQPFCLSSPPDCDTLMAETLVQICTNYQTGVFSGNLCSRMCESDNSSVPSLIPISCPEFSSHSGKTCVLEVKNLQTSSSIILKSRTLTIEELTGRELTELLNQSSKFYSHAILDLLYDRFHNNLNRNLQSVSQNLSQNELLNSWFLLLDNEYLLSSSRVLNRLFPPVIGTCGHFYAVQYVDRILDFSYFVPNVLPFYQFQSTRERLQLALDLLHFLRRFQRSKPKLELCDLKYSHFGYFESSDSNSSLHLVLLDSDMIYPLTTVNQSITSVTSCTSDEDCHFVDCQGECHPQKGCRLNQSDTDLKRLCRNLLFMGQLYNFPLEFGLFSGIEEDQEVERLKSLCFEAENNNNNLDSMETIIRQMLMNYA